MNRTFFVKDYSMVKEQEDGYNPKNMFWEDYNDSTGNRNLGGYPLPDINNQYVSNINITPLTENKLTRKFTSEKYFEEAKTLDRVMKAYQDPDILGIFEQSMMIACALDFSKRFQLKPGTEVNLHFFNFWDKNTGIPTAGLSIAEQKFEKYYIQPINDIIKALHDYYNKSSTSNTPKGLIHRYIKYL